MTSTLATSEDTLSLLAWHIAMGADETIADTPVNAFTAPPPVPIAVAAHTAKTSSPLPNQPQKAAGPTPIVAKAVQPMGGAGVEAAKAAAAACTTLDELEAALKAFDGGTLKRSAKNTVFAAGDPTSPVMVMGDVPDSAEDSAGVPFVGPAGQLLDKMLAAIGLGRDNGAYLTNFIPWRPLGKAKPTPETIAMLHPFAAKHIELAAPKILVLLGGLPSSALYGNTDTISRLRGKWKDVTVGSHSIPTITLYHPERLLQNPQQKAAAWQDLLSLKEKMTAL